MGMKDFSSNHNFTKNKPLKRVPAKQIDIEKTKYKVGENFEQSCSFHILVSVECNVMLGQTSMVRTVYLLGSIVYCLSIV